MIIAITGTIGSGKTYYLNKINEIYSCAIFSCDEFTLKAYEQKEIIKKLDENFSCLVNDKIDKSIIKSKLNENTIKLLNDIIHPFIIKSILNIKDKYKNDIAFIEVPLLFECNMQDMFDASICISVNEQLRNKRLLKRNADSYSFMKSLEKYQKSSKEKEKLATYVLKTTENEKLNLERLNDIMQVILNK